MNRKMPAITKIQPTSRAAASVATIGKTMARMPTTAMAMPIQSIRRDEDRSFVCSSPAAESLSSRACAVLMHQSPGAYHENATMRPQHLCGCWTFAQSGGGLVLCDHLLG